MKNMYAVKCLYEFNFYDGEHKLVDGLLPSWEERIILIKASSLDDASNKCETYAKEYEEEYINIDNQIVKIKLYEIIDIFEIFDTKARNNIEVYSNQFSASEEDVDKMLDIEYPIEN